MEFDEALELARLIRARDGWHVTEIGPKSGERLEDDVWSVTAICTLNWHYIHYWGRPGAVSEWPRYASSMEDGFRHRASSHEI